MPKNLPLKVGAQVMLVKNIVQGVLVNGTLGRVVGFYRPREAAKLHINVLLPEARDPGGEDDPALRAREEQRAQAEQREQRLKKILALDSVWPAVQFASGPLALCVPLSFEAVTAEGSVEAVREQVPLILAWALSIHKSQGQTLDRVRVDLTRIFEKGQGERLLPRSVACPVLVLTRHSTAYVALSRATRMETLQVVNFDPSKCVPAAAPPSLH